MFVAINIYCDKSFVTTSILLSRQKTCFAATNTRLSQHTCVCRDNFFFFFFFFCRDKNDTCVSSSNDRHVPTIAATLDPAGDLLLRPVRVSPWAVNPSWNNTLGIRPNGLLLIPSIHTRPSKQVSPFLHHSSVKQSWLRNCSYMTEIVLLCMQNCTSQRTKRTTGQHRGTHITT